MRFLIVYQDFSKPAQEVVDRFGVEDVTILIVRKGETQACAEFVAEFKAHPNAPTALCYVHRKYKKSIAPLVDVQCEIKGKKFRPDDQVLTAWLRPPEVIDESFDTPSAAMVAASASAEHLVIADGALEHADEVAERRWRFVSRSADLLARYARGESLGPLRNWKNQYRVDFAANGRVRYEYRVISKGEEVEGGTEWHLKEGDNTTRESAARIYFERVEVGGDVKILVFYVGPHPSDGSYSVTIDAGGR